MDDWFDEDALCALRVLRSVPCLLHIHLRGAIELRRNHLAIRLPLVLDRRGHVRLVHILNVLKDLSVKFVEVS